MGPIYLAYDLNSGTELIGAYKYKSSAREAIYNFLLDAGYTLDEWVKMAEDTGCKDTEQLAETIKLTPTLDDYFAVKVEEVWVEE